MKEPSPAGLRRAFLSGSDSIKLHAVARRSIRVGAGSFIVSMPTRSSPSTVLNVNRGGAKYHRSKARNLIRSQQGISNYCIRASHVAQSAASASAASGVENPRKDAAEHFDWEKCWYPIGESCCSGCHKTTQLGEFERSVTGILSLHVRSESHVIGYGILGTTKLVITRCISDQPFWI